MDPAERGGAVSEEGRARSIGATSRRARSRGPQVCMRQAASRAGGSRLRACGRENLVVCGLAGCVLGRAVSDTYREF